MAMLPLPSPCAGAPGTPPPALRRAPGVALALALTAGLTACGQKGSLVIPDTPPAAQRATLPQTIFGGARSNKHRAAPDRQAGDDDRQQEPRPDARDTWPDPDLDDQP